MKGRRNRSIHPFPNVLPLLRLTLLALAFAVGNRYRCNSLSPTPTNTKSTPVPATANMSTETPVVSVGRRQRRRNRHRTSKATGEEHESEIETSQNKPLFSIGMIADIQYAPVPDGASFSGTPRYYRHSLEATKHAFESFRDYAWKPDNDKEGIDSDSENDQEQEDDATVGVDLVINLGDTIDGKCQDIERNGGCALSTESGECDIDGNANGNNNADNNADADATNGDNDTLWKDLLDQPGKLSLLEVQNAMKAYTERTNKDAIVLHSYGNHCLYNLNRRELRETLGIPFRQESQAVGTFGSFSQGRREESISRSNSSPPRETPESGDDDGDLVGYYSYVYPPQPQEQSTDNDNTNNDTTTTTHHNSVKFLFLDGYDICLMRRDPQFSQKRKRAVELLQQHNGKNFAAGNENSPEGLEGLEKRFVAFNGAVGPTQLEWLRDELEATREWNNRLPEQQQPQRHRQRVVILSHNTIHPESSNPVCLMWNYDQVLEILREYSDVVVASFAGHAHKGGYVRDETSKIHFRVVEAVLESKPPLKTFGILDVYSDRLDLHGYGDCKSAVYEFEDEDEDEESLDDRST